MTRTRSWTAAAVIAMATIVVTPAVAGASPAQSSPAKVIPGRPLPGDPATSETAQADRVGAAELIAPPVPVVAVPDLPLPGDPEPAPVPDRALPDRQLPGPPSSSRLIGYDVSWPQCGEVLPEGQAFAIVGVTGGLATTTNPCFARQLEWAQTSTGATGQPRVALYVNTANPALEGSWWPTSDVYAGEVVANPYGTCTGVPGAACAYVYGWAKAYDDVALRGVSQPETYLWWLDVETENTWQGDREANRAVLEGMTTYFEGIGARVGLYSTGYQWWQIVGTVPTSSNLYDLPSWLAGARNLKDAQDICSRSPLTAGGTVSMVQYISRDLDHNWSCI